MADTAARWVDELLPDVPYRQWVLSIPPPLRYLLAYDSKLLSVLLRAFVRAIENYLRRQAKSRYKLPRLSDAKPGALVVVQRFGSALNLNPHLHVLVADGVFVAEGESYRFLKLGAPNPGELRAVAWDACTKTLEYLRADGRFLALGEDSGTIDGDDPLALDAPVLAEIYGASVVGRLALGPRSGQRVLRFVSNPQHEAEQRLPGVMGFDAHASVSIYKGQRKALERLCRYLLRPPAAADRFEALPDGRVSLKLKRAWSNGTTHIVLTAQELVEKLAALVPPPRVNQVRYYGVFAPRSKMRDLILPKVDPAATSEAEVVAAQENSCSSADDDGSSNQKCYRHTWAALLDRVFDIDVLACPRCQSRMQRIAFIFDPDVIAAMLESIGHAADSPVAA